MRSTRTTVLVLGGIRLRAEAGQLHLAATDMEVSLRTAVDALVADEGTDAEDEWFRDRVADNIEEVFDENFKAIFRTDGQRLPTKTAASRASVPLLPALERELRAHRSRQAERNLRHIHRDALVFSTMRGRPQSRRNTLRAVQEAAEKVGLHGDGRERVGVHDLRHTFVAIALANGVTLPQAAMLARHANPRVTLAVYAGLTDGAREVAVSKLLDAGFRA